MHLRGTTDCSTAVVGEGLLATGVMVPVAAVKRGAQSHHDLSHSHDEHLGGVPTAITAVPMRQGVHSPDAHGRDCLQGIRNLASVMSKPFLTSFLGFV